MLVLSRQRDESIIIGDNIIITIVDIRGDKVRLGIEAPTEIPVHRQEVYEAIQRENAKAQEDGRPPAVPLPKRKKRRRGLRATRVDLAASRSSTPPTQPMQGPPPEELT